ncbi:MAG: iron hydrogenase small subunit [Candidatus Marinimicrobia bacterium]|nr:iron hydrogenase small subunit [Candidatus Neomarinimicrobiota bacterium]
MSKQYITLNGKKTEIKGDEKNLLELIRNNNIEIPTFCYHSHLSTYGACRMCVVDIEGRGIQTSCSIKPQEGMVVRTHTEDVRKIRKIALELLLANHDQSCPTCERSDSCKLRKLSAQLNIRQGRLHQTDVKKPLDDSSYSLVRDPNKCVLCGDCVRYCAEIQGIGALDFAYRGTKAAVLPAFGKPLNEVECVNCGQCAAVCPTGAISVKSNVQQVWAEIDNKDKMTIVQIAPAVRVAIGEMFNLPPGKIRTGKLVAALKTLGFDKVFDTSFSADLTVIEEANEFLNRKMKGEKLPLFTSCCPAWVKYAEQYHSDLLDNLSTCKSPQQMFGAMAKSELAAKLGIDPKNMSVISIMPCTAKKYEAGRLEFEKEGIKEVDWVMTTQEIGKMIKEAGIQFDDLANAAFDLPYGFATGGGVIFGNSGGVSEAVLRYAHEKLTGNNLEYVEYEEVRGNEGIREAKIVIGDMELSMAIVHGLKNAGEIAKAVKNGEVNYDIIEVMACPNGCVGGAGQPVVDNPKEILKRKEGIYATDRLMSMHKPQNNPFIRESYEKFLGEINGHKVHELLHTSYSSKKRIFEEGITVWGNEQEAEVTVKICVGTACYLKHSQKLLHDLIGHFNNSNLKNRVDIEATFCMESCETGPNVLVNNEIIRKATSGKVIQEITKKLA